MKLGLLFFISKLWDILSPWLEYLGCPLVDIADETTPIVVSENIEKLIKYTGQEGVMVEKEVEVIDSGYSWPTLRSLPAPLQIFVIELRRKDLDNQSSAPLLRYNMERPVLEGNIVEVSIIKRIKRTETATLFQTGHGLIIKYQVDCDNNGFDIHPLIRDYWFLKKIESFNISPKVFFISPATRLQRPLTEKSDFALREIESCVNWGPVRYMVMERMGRSIFESVNDKKYGHPFPLGEALRIFVTVMENLRIIHQQGVVHGDIHPGNIVLGPDGEYKLIDFGTAQLISELLAQRITIRDPFSYSHCLLSHWSIEGYRKSYRDDVFNAVFVLANMINGSGYIDHCVSLSTDVHALYMFKKESFLFEYPDSPLSVRTMLERVDIRSSFSQLLSLARPLHNIIDRSPEYTAIISKARNLIAIL